MESSPIDVVNIARARDSASGLREATAKSRRSLAVKYREDARIEDVLIEGPHGDVHVDRVVTCDGHTTVLSSTTLVARTVEVRRRGRKPKRLSFADFAFAPEIDEETLERVGVLAVGESVKIDDGSITRID